MQWKKFFQLHALLILHQKQMIIDIYDYPMDLKI